MTEYIYDRTRSKNPIAVPDEADVRDQQLEINKWDRLIANGELLEEFLRSEPHDKLQALSRARLFDLLRQSLTVNLTADPKDLAFHQEIRGRIRERLDILDAASEVRSVIGRWKTRVKGIINRMRQMDEDVQSRKKE